MLMPTKILVPTDFSALFVIKLYVKPLTLRNSIMLRFMYSTWFMKNCDTIDDYGITYPSYVKEIETKMTKEAKKKLKDQINKFPQTKELEIVSDVLIGNTSEAILEEEKRKDIDLIVIASLGRSGIAKYLIGSVARNVLKGAKCPVLLTK